MSFAIQINDLNKTYSNGTQAIKNISLNIEEGDFYALLGANGAGKTTTINIMTSLVNKTAGTVKIFGVDIDKNFSEAKRYIGVVPQEFNFSIFEKVLDVVVNQAGYYGIPFDIAKPRAIEILTRLGLGNKLDTVSRALSGGMKRRLMIARALIHQPRLLILDEPTAGVDVELRLGMWDYLREMNEQNGVTILLTTHYLEEVEQLCKNAAIIKEGEIVKQDTVRNLLNSLDEEIYQVEINDTAQLITKLAKANPSSQISDKIKIVDDHILELVIKKNEGLNEAIAVFSMANIKILAIRPKGNRLEELFLNVINK